MVIFSTSVYSSSASYKNMTIEVPDEWKINASVLYDENGAKEGELISKKSWPYNSGLEFINAFKKGFVDDPESIKYISSGSEKDVFWVCRSGIYEDGKGGFGIWYSRTFWVNGPIAVFYSYRSCEEKFNEALEVAKTLKEK